MIPDWLHAPAGLALRETTQADRPFLKSLYRELRAAELAQTDWARDKRETFADDQFEKQDAWYRSNYPGAVFMLIERDGIPIGRLYLSEGGSELRLMELTLASTVRGKGLGTSIIKALIEREQARGLAMTLHVEWFSPAKRLYERLGFTAGEPNGIYLPLRRDPIKPG
jgi:GNAT superfamily N-acetyltransferase